MAKANSLFFSYILEKDYKLIEKLTSEFNKDAGLDLSKQKFMMRLVREEAKRKNIK